jgi:prepilin-type N-terminal cleavage/methylation domain-containing protein
MQHARNLFSDAGTNDTRNHAGFSLIELVIAMTVFLIVTGAIWGVMNVAQKGRAAINEKVDLGKSSRVGMNLLGRDTYNAGYAYPLGNTVVLPDNRISSLLLIPNDFDATRDTVPPIIAGNNTTLNTYTTLPNVRTDQVTFLFKDPTFNLVTGVGGNVVSQPLNINAATTVNGIDEIVPISGSNAACRVNDIYLINGNTGSALGLATGLGTNTVQFSNGDVLGLNQTGVGGPLRGITTPASMLRVKMVTYFVTAGGVLTRREYANVPPATPAVGFVDEPLVYGVEDFQIRYVLDDGTITDNPSAGVDGIPGTTDDQQAMLARVRQVRYTITVRTVEGGMSGNPQRDTLTSTFSTRNLGYDAN